jgi:hypothetical protein
MGSNPIESTIMGREKSKPDQIFDSIASIGKYCSETINSCYGHEYATYSNRNGLYSSYCMSDNTLRITSMCAITTITDVHKFISELRSNETLIRKLSTEIQGDLKKLDLVVVSAGSLKCIMNCLVSGIYIPKWSKMIVKENLKIQDDTHSISQIPSRLRFLIRTDLMADYYIKTKSNDEAVIKLQQLPKDQHIILFDDSVKTGTSNIVNVQILERLGFKREFIHPLSMLNEIPHAIKNK